MSQATGGLPDSHWRGYVESAIESADSITDFRHLQDIIVGHIGEEHIGWEPVGGDENNAGLGNTTGPMGAFVEKPVNGIDGYTDLYHQPDDDHNNVHEFAAERYDGNEEVHVMFDGDKSKGGGETDINVTTIDNAVGQAPPTFGIFFDTFNSGQHKRGRPMFHGCRGVGGMAALGHTKEGDQLIVSAAADTPNVWSVGIVRKNGGTYEYMTVDGDVPTFEGELDLHDEVGTLTHGTAVKLYGYEFTRAPELATNEAFRRKLSLELENPAATIRLTDKRSSNTDYVSQTFNGIEQAATGAYAPVFNDPIHESRHIEGLGVVDIIMLAAKPRSERQSIAANVETGVDDDELVTLNRFFTSDDRDRVLISANGRVHATDTRHLLGSKGNLDSINHETYVIARLTEPPETVEDGPFTLARDGFTNGTMESRLYETIYQVVRNCDKIQTWDTERTDDETDSTDRSPDTQSTLRVEQEEFVLAKNSNTIEVPLTCDALPENPVFEVGDEHLTVAGVEQNGTSTTLSITVDADQHLSGPIVEQTSRVATTNISVKPAWATGSVDEKLSENTLKTYFDTDLETAHEDTLDRLSEREVAPVAAHILDTNELDGLLTDAEQLMNEATPLLKRIAATEGADPEQWARNATGSLFEVLVYARLVHACEQGGFTAYHEPTIEMFAGVTHHNDREPDTDIVVTSDADNPNAPLYILSLKTSLKDRATQMAYWSRVFRDATATCGDHACPTSENSITATRPIRYKYVTLSRDREPTDILLRELDGGYAPAGKVVESHPEQEPLSTLPTDVIETWASVQPPTTETTTTEPSQSTGVLSRLTALAANFL